MTGSLLAVPDHRAMLLGGLRLTALLFAFSWVLAGLLACGLVALRESRFALVRAVAGLVVDDVALAHLVKAHGRPVRYPVGKALLHVRMYDGLGALWRGWRKAFVGTIGE